VLLGEDGAKWGAGDRSAFCVDGKIWVNNHAHVLRPRGDISHCFIALCLTILDLTPYITGTTVPKLNQEKMSQILIPLPPLAEQKRIVAKIEELRQVTQALTM
jgi:type I restriction enzyme S subunit